jgi:membrane protein
MQVSIKSIGQLLVQAGKSFTKDRIPKLSASLAYYTIFSLGPMMIVIIYLADVFLGRQAIEGSIYEQVKGLVGNQAAFQVQEIIKNASVSGKSTVTAIVGFVALIVGATTVFSEIQDSINSIWKLKVKTERGWLKMLLNRLLSFSLVVSLGFLLLVSLLLNALVEGFMDRLQELFPHTAVILIYIINLLLTFLIIWSLFAIIFKVLPDAVIRWKDVAVGAFFTAFLFMAGKFGISFYIGQTDIGSTYGTAGSLVNIIVVGLLFGYYFILRC